MKKRVLVGSVLIGATIVALGLGAGPALADPGNTDNNGNHYGWYKENGQNYTSSQYSSVLLGPPGCRISRDGNLETGAPENLIRFCSKSVEQAGLVLARGLALCFLGEKS